MKQLKKYRIVRCWKKVPLDKVKRLEDHRTSLGSDPEIMLAEEYMEHFLSKAVLKRKKFISKALVTATLIKPFEEERILNISTDWVETKELSPVLDSDDAATLLWNLRKYSDRKHKEYYYASEV